MYMFSFLNFGSTDHSFGNNLQGTLLTVIQNLTQYIKPKFVTPPSPLQKFSSCTPCFGSSTANCSEFFLKLKLRN